MNNFKMAQPQSIEQVKQLFSEPRNKYFFIAGGTDLLGEIKDEIIFPEVVVDLKSIPELSYIEKDKGGAARIGALTTVAELAENSMIRKEYSGLHQAASAVATPQLRHMGTVGGNLCQRPRCWYYRDPQIKCRKKGGSRCFAIRGKNKYHAIMGGGICNIVHPSDLAPMLMALEAEILIASPKRDKVIPLKNFFILPKVNVRRENILAPGEIIKEVKIPAAKSGEKSTYLKLRERGAWDFALVSAAVKALVKDHTFKQVKIVLGGVAPIPWRLKKAESLIQGQKITKDLIKRAVRYALKETRPLSDNAYKKELAEVAVSRAAMSLV
ncbi:MAG: FAD binding domain-containing protein [Candidatus Aminicenantales bacterium]